MHSLAKGLASGGNHAGDLGPEIDGGKRLSLVGTKLLDRLGSWDPWLYPTTFQPGGDLGQASAALDLFLLGAHHGREGLCAGTHTHMMVPFEPSRLDWEGSPRVGLWGPLWPLKAL